jgi:predicted AlkP superfamily phosphohydrolase/phosphomutase
MHAMTRAWLGSAAAMLAITCSFFPACRENHTDPLVVLLCLDGADPDIVARLRAEGKLPHLDELMRSGTSSPMESVAAKRVLRPDPRLGLWSPIIWASLATGVIPEKHGILDFLLPLPGTAFSWIGSEHGPPQAEVLLPEIKGRPPFTLRVRLHSYRPNGSQAIEVLVNGESVASLAVGEKWETVSASLPEELLRPGQNRLELHFSKQSRPSDQGPSRDDRPLAGALSSIEVEDATGEILLSMDPVSQRFDHVNGFYPPEADLVEAQSGHLRSRPLWSLLGESGHPVGIVGYWSTWPASEVNGFLVSSHMGLRGRRQNTRTELTWPPELVDELQPLLPTDAEIKETLADLYPPDCSPTNERSLSVFEQVLWQDELYFRSAKHLLPTLRSGFFTVYLESIDVAGHTFLPFRDGAALPPNCPSSVREVVEKIYQKVDTWMGALIEELPREATVLVVSDHGMVTAGSAGYHARYGIFVANGLGIRRGVQFQGASVLDVAPTILHRFDEAIPLAMDGKTLVQAFDPDWLDRNPPRYRDVPLAVVEEPVPLTEGSEEVIDRLRSIGYLQ